MRRFFLFASIGVGALVACSAASLTVVPADRPTDPQADEDAGDPTPSGRAEAGIADAAVEAEALTDSGCPAPPKITPTNVPAGYLKAVKVTLDHMADGDSGDFNFPGAPKQGVRSLFINTEESYGDAGTEWGVIVKGRVKTYFDNATDIQIAVRETFAGSGVPNEDTYHRWLSLIFLNGELYQTRAIREGLSAYYTDFGCAPKGPIHDSLLYAEAEANAADRGIWGPEPPAHNDYSKVLATWIGTSTCRPNPFKTPYCK